MSPLFEGDHSCVWQSSDQAALAGLSSRAVGLLVTLLRGEGAVTWAPRGLDQP